MRIFFIIFAFITSCINVSIIENEKNFLEKNKELSLEEAINKFGEVDDSLMVRDGKVMIWDNLNGKMVRMTAPPYTPLDSVDWFGKRNLQILFDTSSNKMKSYRYWDYTNPEDFEVFIKNKTQ